MLTKPLCSVNDQIFINSTLCPCSGWGKAILIFNTFVSRHIVRVMGR